LGFSTESGGRTQQAKIGFTIGAFDQNDADAHSVSVGRWPPKTNHRPHREYKLVTHWIPSLKASITAWSLRSQDEDYDEGYRRLPSRQENGDDYDTELALADAYRARVCSASGRSDAQAEQ